MVTVPTPDQREIITRRPFLDEAVGEMVARQSREGPLIDLSLQPYDTEPRVELGITPTEARELAEQLRDVADVAQRAGWTPAVLANVRERYLPGASDEEIMARLDQLTEEVGSSVLGYQTGTLDWRAGRVLTAKAGADVAERASGALENAVSTLTDVEALISRLTEMRDTFADLAQFYRHESERPR